LRILHLTQYFPPEPGAVQVRAHAMASNLVKRGHQVTVLTEMPNHPVGIIPPEYRGKILVRERLDNIDVVRVWVKTSPRKNFRTRLAFYLSYMVDAMLRGLLLRGRYDVVFVNSPPLFVGAAGLALSYLRRTPFVFEVQDLWPESAVEMGELKDPRFIRWATWLEEQCYHRAQRIVVVTDGIYERLRERGYPAEKLALIENGSNTAIFRPQPEETRTRVRAELGLQDRFIAIYGGIMGLAQGVETLIETARLLVEEPDVHVLLVGGGPRRQAVEELVESYRLPNLTLLPSQSLEAMPAYLSAADVALVPLRDLDLFHGARPTKMFDAWACQRPTVVSVTGEARRIMEEADAGLAAEPENPADIARAVLELRDDTERRQRLGLNGQRYVDAHYSLQAMALKLERVLLESIGAV
jgi:glycosyltransferase involved in cell wall biosynthesis